MKYDITKPQVHQMPTLGNGTECIRRHLSQVSKDMYDSLVLMLYPYLAHISALQNFNLSTQLEGVLCPNGTSAA